MKIQPSKFLINIIKQIKEKISFFFILFIILSSCNYYPEEVKRSLSTMSAENKLKFEQVFEHFGSSNDSLKLKAAYFLVENMEGLGYYEGKQKRDYNVIFDILASKPADYKENLPWYSNGVSLIFDSLERIFGPINLHNLHYVRDVDVFTSEAMIKYIDDAFSSWNNPWSIKYVSFHDFCNYVLPYRNFDETLEPWREMFTKKYKWIYDSAVHNEDILEVARMLNRGSELKYSDGFQKYTTSIAPSLLLKAMYGNCTDNSNYKAMIMRAQGIPATIDFMPQYGSDHNKHYWNSIMDRNGNFESFEEPLQDINAWVAYKYRIGKVYRKTFSINKAIEKLLIETKGNVPQLFLDTKFIDVTSQYVAVTSVNLNLKNIPDLTKYAFIAVFNDAGWTPIDFAEIINDQSVEFKNMGREVMYLPLFFSNNQYIPASYPFYITKKGYIDYIEPKTEKTHVTLIRKYHDHQRMVNWLKCLNGGKFEGANQPDFSDAVTLAIIRHIPREHFEELSSVTDKSFKYLRFVFSLQELTLPYEGDGASIAEIEFINIDGQKIKGIPVGSPGRKYNPYTPNLCFDGNPLTFFEDSRFEIISNPFVKLEKTGTFFKNIRKEMFKYVGLKLNNPTRVSKIRYIARNDMNSIQPGDIYELFYWNNETFTSLGKKIAYDTIIEFDNVPKGSLLWLRDLSGGKEERIFTWEKGMQVWW
jgi:hypothetical protein